MSRAGSIVAIIMVLGLTSYAQQAEKEAPKPYTGKKSERKLVREGNEYFEEKKYSDAEVKYRQALDVKANMTEGVYNLGNAEYNQDRWDDAIEHYRLSAQIAETKEEKAKAYHNLGNAYLKKEEYQKSVGAYIESLKRNPLDADTKYNLAYAQLMLKKQQQEGGGEGEDDENKEDQEDQNEGDKNEENKDQQGDQEQENKEGEGENEDQTADNKNQEGEGDKKEEQGKDGEQKDEQKEGKGQQVKVAQMTPEEADRLMQQLLNKEQKVQAKMQREKYKGEKIKIEKDW